MSVYSIIILITIIAFTAGLWRIFEKAHEKGWYVLIPFFNIWVLLRVIRKPWWWYIFLLVPYINVFVFLLIVVELLKCFEKYSLLHQALGVMFPFIYIPWMGFSQREHYLDPDQRPNMKKGAMREWLDAIIFAVIAATLIRTFLIEAYTIPTPSMEKSMLVGDFLFVSKVAYGPKVPQTPLSFPFVHNTMPLSRTSKSYLEWIKLPYHRFPGFSEIKNNDVVVFHYPDGDTVGMNILDRSYYATVRSDGWKRVNNNERKYGKIVARPVDKRENYIKRCIAIAGDTLQIINQDIYINGKLQEVPGKLQFRYKVTSTSANLSKRMLEKLNITEDIGYEHKQPTDEYYTYYIPLSDESAKKIKTFPNIIDAQKIVQKPGHWETFVFPFDSNYKWNNDNYGPIYIPKAGSTVELNTVTLPLYERIIDVYEGNELEIKGDSIYVNGQLTSTYTFKMDYYWMMGDNRHNSADSRYWGFVPTDHIVGKAVFVWMSLDKNKGLFDGKFRWNKMFRMVK